MISELQFKFKRLFDLTLSLILVPLLIVPMLFLIGLATIDTKQWGIFTQSRVGQFGKRFKIYKIRTLRSEPHLLGRLEQSATPIGVYIRKTRLDELPQLFNIIASQMSFVGPRPDIPGFADLLTEEDRVILKLKPGLTGPATLKYKHEESLLRSQINPEYYYKTVIWPDKVEINKKYIQTWSFSLDLKYIFKSVFGLEE